MLEQAEVHMDGSRPCRVALEKPRQYGYVSWKRKRAFSECCDVSVAITCHLGTRKNSASKFKDDSEDAGLLDRERTGADARRVPAHQVLAFGARTMERGQGVKRAVEQMGRIGWRTHWQRR